MSDYLECPDDDDVDDDSEVVINKRDLIKKAGFHTQNELAETLGITRVTVNRWVKGHAPDAMCTVMAWVDGREIKVAISVDDAIAFAGENKSLILMTSLLVPPKS
jgi:hypothetical protein